MTAPPVDQHRLALEAVISAAISDLANAWIDGDPVAIRDALAVSLPPLAAEYGSAAATLGADWYDDLRAAAGEPGRFRAIPAELPDEGLFESLVGWGTTPLFVGSPDLDGYQPKLGDPDFVPDLDAAKTRMDGGFQKLVADMNRDTIQGSLRRDPRGKGWSRQTTGKSCPFCVMLAGRGTVYSAQTANFSSHNNCDCIAVPIFGSDPRPVVPYVPSQRRQTDSQRAASNARVREFIRANP